MNSCIMCLHETSIKLLMCTFQCVLASHQTFHYPSPEVSSRATYASESVNIDKLAVWTWHLRPWSSHGRNDCSSTTVRLRWCAILPWGCSCRKSLGVHWQRKLTCQHPRCKLFLLATWEHWNVTPGSDWPHRSARWRFSQASSVLSRPQLIHRSSPKLEQEWVLKPIVRFVWVCSNFSLTRGWETAFHELSWVSPPPAPFFQS